MKHIHLTMRDLNQIITAESHRGKTTEELVHYLRARGWPEPSARHFVRNALAKSQAQTLATLDNPAVRHGEGDDREAVDPDSDRQARAWVLALVCIFFCTLVLISALSM